MSCWLFCPIFLRQPPFCKVIKQKTLSSMIYSAFKICWLPTNQSPKQNKIKINKKYAKIVINTTKNINLDAFTAPLLLIKTGPTTSYSTAQGVAFPLLCRGRCMKHSWCHFLRRGRRSPAQVRWEPRQDGAGVPGGSSFIQQRAVKLESCGLHAHGTNQSGVQVAICSPSQGSAGIFKNISIYIRLFENPNRNISNII